MSVGQCYLLGVKNISSNAYKATSWLRVLFQISAEHPAPRRFCIGVNMTDITSCRKTFRQLIKFQVAHKRERSLTIAQQLLFH